MKKNKQYYSRIYLLNKFGLQTHRTESDYAQLTHSMAVISEILQEQEGVLFEPELKTKEQLYALGFKVAQICEFFELKTIDKTNNIVRWKLKDKVIINNERIRTVNHLLKTLNANSVKFAS